MREVLALTKSYPQRLERAGAKSAAPSWGGGDWTLPSICTLIPSDQCLAPGWLQQLPALQSRPAQGHWQRGRWGRGARASARKGLGHGRLGSGCVTGDPHSRRVGQSALLHYNKALERSHLGRKEDRHGSETRLRDPISWATWWGSMVQSKARIERGGRKTGLLSVYSTPSAT